ncbi:helix-turn-helix domain-containing protein [Microbispora rosea]|uniref:helix-turn-helix domain-containing protein n=1 Tax=Microbispora rosea TaxID=58117 RepID=UPI003D8DF209
MPDEERLEDVQEMTTADMTVYEAVAALNTQERPATVADVAAMTGLPEDDVRRCLDSLAEGGRLVPKGDAYTLGTHDWGLEY